MSNGGRGSGYRRFSGAYDRELNEDGRLPISSGTYYVHLHKVPRAVAFWNDQGKDAILFSVNRFGDWELLDHYYTYAYGPKTENLFYYDKGNRQYMQTRILTPARHWAVSLIPRSEVKITSMTQGRYPFGTGQGQCARAG